MYNCFFSKVVKMNKLIALGLISLTSVFMLAYGFMYNPKAGYFTTGVATTGYGGAMNGLWEFLVFSKSTLFFW